MDIDKQNQSAAPNQAFVDRADSLQGPRDAAHLIHNLPRRRHIEDLPPRGMEQPGPVECDHPSGEQGSPIVRRLVAFAPQQRDADPDEGGDGSQGIGPMVPGIRLDRGAADRFPRFEQLAKHEFLGDHDDHEHHEGEGFWQVVGMENLPAALDRDRDRSPEQSGRHRQSGQGFRFAITIRVALVRRLTGDLQTPQDHHGTDDIKHRLNPIRDQGIRVSQKAGDDFDDPQNRAGHNAVQGRPNALVHGIFENGLRRGTAHGDSTSCAWRSAQTKPDAVAAPINAPAIHFP